MDIIVSRQFLAFVISSSRCLFRGSKSKKGPVFFGLVVELMTVQVAGV